MADKKLIESAVIKLFNETSQETGDLDKDTIKRIVKDIDVNSALNKIERSVSGREIFVRAARKNISDAELEKVEGIFADVKFNRLLNYVLKARIFGNYAFEIIYNEDYTVDTLVPIPNECVDYNNKDKRWELKVGNSKQEITYEKFLLCIHKWLPNKVVGESIFEPCNVSFLDKELFTNQLRGIAKKYGDVIAVVAYDPDEDEDEIKERAESIKAAKGENVIMVPVERGGANQPTLQESVHFIRLADLDPEIYTTLADREKTKLIQNILGSTLTMDVGRTGTQALGTVHMEAEEQVVEECCSFISDCLQNLLKTVSELWGFNHKDYYFSLEKKRDKKADLEVEEKEETITQTKINNIAVLTQSGIKVSVDYVAEYLGIDKKHLSEAPVNVVEFARGRKYPR
ncbi:phage portal protein family protein [Cetobacterium somerae]|uniref:phage portal protein family protein n=1 Tax=Cetobacterium somerae TaxID=188913 RepID=UPI003D767C45